jgi:hypothetical protein
MVSVLLAARRLPDFQDGITLIESGGPMEAGTQQRTVSSCPPTAPGRAIANRWMWHHRVPQGACERLELLAGKLSRAVLRGLGGSNLARLPGGVRVTGSSTSFSVRPLTPKCTS